MDKEHAVMQIIQYAKVLGWSVALPTVGEDEEVPGLLLGTDEYLQKMLVESDTDPNDVSIIS